MSILVFISCIAGFITLNFIATEWQQERQRKHLELVFEAKALTDKYFPHAQANEVLCSQLLEQYVAQQDQQNRFAVKLQIDHTLDQIYGHLTSMSDNQASFRKRFARIRATCEYDSLCDIQQRMQMCWLQLNEIAQVGAHYRDWAVDDISYADCNLWILY